MARRAGKLGLLITQVLMATSSADVAAVAHGVAPLSGFGLAFGAWLELDAPADAIEFVWSRADGRGPRLALTVTAVSAQLPQRRFNATLMRLVPLREYDVEAWALISTPAVAAATSEAEERATTVVPEWRRVRRVLGTRATAGRTGLVSLDGALLDDAADSLCTVEDAQRHGRSASFGVLVFDHPANGTVLLGCDRMGALVWYFAPQATSGGNLSPWGVASQLGGGGKTGGGGAGGHIVALLNVAGTHYHLHVEPPGAIRTVQASSRRWMSDNATRFYGDTPVPTSWLRLSRQAGEDGRGTHE